MGVFSGQEIESFNGDAHVLTKQLHIDIVGSQQAGDTRTGEEKCVGQPSHVVAGQDHQGGQQLSDGHAVITGDDELPQLMQQVIGDRAFIFLGRHHLSVENRVSDHLSGQYCEEEEITTSTGHERVVEGEAEEHDHSLLDGHCLEDLQIHSIWEATEELDLALESAGLGKTEYEVDAHEHHEQEYSGDSRGPALLVVERPVQAPSVGQGLPHHHVQHANHLGGGHREGDDCEDEGDCQQQ